MRGDPQGDAAEYVPDPGGYALNVQPQGNGTMLVGSSRQFSGFDRKVNKALLRASMRRATRFIPRLKDMQVVRSWAGLRPYTRDKLPIIGPVEAVPGFHIASGHEGLGITLAMATGDLIARGISSTDKSEWQAEMAPFRLERFSEVHSG